MIRFIPVFLNRELMKKQILLIVLLLLSAGLKLWSQEIKGFVLDEEKKPLAYCNIVGYQADSTFVTGTTSDKKGFYSLRKDPKIRFLKFSCLSYKTKLIVLEELKSPTILRTQDLELGEVRVRADRPKLKLKGTALELPIKGTSLALEQDMLGVLGNVPGLRATPEGEINLLKGGKLLILLNGREVHSLEELKHLDVKRIESVALENTPSARYKNDVSAVLMIRTSKLIPDNFSFYIASSLKQASRFSQEHSLDLSYATKRANYFLHLTGLDTRDVEEKDVKTFVDLKEKGLGTQGLASNLNSIMSKRAVKVQLGTDLELGKNLSLGFKYNLYYPKFLYTLDTKTKVYKSERLQEDLKAEVGGVYREPSQHFNGFAQYKFADAWQLTLNGDLVLKNVAKKHNVQEIGQKKTNQYNNVILSDNDYRLWQLTPICRYKFGTSYVEVGGDINQIQAKNEQSYSGVSNNDLVNKEWMYATFANYGLSFLGTCSAELGLRYEYAQSKLENLLNPKENLDRKYSNLFFTGKFSAPIGQTFHSLSFKSSTKRPSLSFLSNQTFELSRYLIQESNPLLKPEKHYLLNYNLAYRWLYLGIGYFYVIDPITNYFYPNEQVLGGYRVNNMNYEDFHQVYLVANVNKTWDWYNLNVKGVFQYDKMNGKSLGLNIKSLPMSYVQVTQWFTLPKTYRIGLDYHFISDMTTNIFRVKSAHMLNLYLNKSFLNDRLTVALKLNDLLGMKQNVSTTIKGLTFSQLEYRDSRYISLKLSYRFNKARSYKGLDRARESIERL